MILIREVSHQDIESMERFGNTPGMFNLSSDRDIIKEKIQKSIDSFSGRTTRLADTKFIFVAEDVEQSRIVGTSMIAGQHGTPDSPHYFFEIGSERKFSETLNTGFIHGTLEMKVDTDGPSEIGGLVVDAEYRKHQGRVGRQISFVRFLFAAIFRERFRPKIIAELLPPLNKRGQSPLWEAIGRRFTNMDYWEADQLSSKNKEFVMSLFPSGKLYTTFLTAEARNAIGKVSKETEPVLHMLKKIGFQYVQNVDPFDGGPHLWATTDDVVPIKSLIRGYYAGVVDNERAQRHGLLTTNLTRSGHFRAVHVSASTVGDKIFLSEDDAKGFEKLAGKGFDLKQEQLLAFMPYY